MECLELSSTLAKLQRVARKAGLEVRKYGSNTRPELRIASYLSQFEIDLVIDVGANRGEFAKSLLECGYAGKIISVEPLPDLQVALKAESERIGKGQWRITDPFALSDKDGWTEFHVTASNAASSMLEPSAAVANRVPQMRTTQTLRVETKRLDALVAANGLALNNAFLKIDVQGGEGKVLAGAVQTLRNLRGAMIEISTVEFYHGQPLLNEVIETMSQFGFEVWDIEPVFRNASNFRLEQCDTVFFKGLPPGG
jgi:FkbM family methyltransferase